MNGNGMVLIVRKKCGEEREGIRNRLLRRHKKLIHIQLDWIH